MSSGRWIYSGSEDGTVKMWDIRNPSNPRDFEKCEDPCTYVCLTPNEVQENLFFTNSFKKKYLLSSYQNGLLRVVDHNTGATRDYRPDGEKPIQSISVDATGKFCCLVNHDGEASVYDINEDPLQNFKLVTKWKAHDRYILKCLFSPDSS